MGKTGHFFRKHGLTDYGEGVFIPLVLCHDIPSLVVIHRIDVADGDELLDVHGFGWIETELLDFLIRRRLQPRSFPSFFSKPPALNSPTVREFERMRLLIPFRTMHFGLRTHLILLACAMPRFSAPATHPVQWRGHP